MHNAWTAAGRWFSVTSLLPNFLSTAFSVRSTSVVDTDEYSVDDDTSNLCLGNVDVASKDFEQVGDATTFAQCQDRCRAIPDCVWVSARVNGDYLDCHIVSSSPLIPSHTSCS